MKEWFCPFVLTLVGPTVPVEEYLKQMNDELPKLAEMIHGDTVNEGREPITTAIDHSVARVGECDPELNQQSISINNIRSKPR